jgi:hypothetical protein
MAFPILSLRGGQNDTDAPTELADDQCVVARNVEFVRAPLGERRRGASAITLPAAITAHTEVTFLHNHVPGEDQTAAELWALGVTGTSSSTMARKTSSWSTMTLDDAIVLTSNYKYKVRAQSLHGKLFLAYKSAAARLHVYDGSGTVRRVGITEPAAAPTAANSGGVGTFAGTRYYRVRFTKQSGGTTLLRSEPSDVLTFAPSGTNATVTVTRPTAVSEGETHWELEASVDNTLFYVIATTAIATTTATDSTVYSPGYADAYQLAPDIGDYTLVPSGKFLCVDRDRLVIAGDYEDSAFASRVTWTPVLKDPGSGNDERLENDQDPRVDLDPGEGGGITGMIAVNGSIWVFKQSRIFKLTASGVRNRAYDVTPISKVRGAIEDSVVEGVDETGNTAIFFLDPSIGPCRINIEGVKQCGKDIENTWRTVNLDANVVARPFYDAEAKQVHWKIATSGATTPNLELVLHVNFSRDAEHDGARRGWVVWDGEITEALAVCMFADNIEASTTRSRRLRPLMGTANSGLVWQTDTGVTDNGTTYAARILTKPYSRAGVMNQFEVQGVYVIGKAVTSAQVDISIEANFELFNKEAQTVSFTPTSSETRVIKNLDNLGLSECRVAQVEIEDTSPAGSARWELEYLILREIGGQQA